MKVIDNKFEKLGDDLKDSIKFKSKLQVCASIFSMYGYEALKKELSQISEFKFIFSDPTFIEISKNSKEQKLFEINTRNTFFFKRI